MKLRFTIDGSEELEACVTALCTGVLRVLQSSIPASQLEAVLLGGGYGRGEGGVLETPEGHRPYNDLEFYVCLRGNRWLNERKYRAVTHALETVSAGAGLDVELKLFSLDQLRCSPINMFYYDLVMGHHWVLGDESLLTGCEHHRRAMHIPLAEATRLLMNRCAGLLFARQRLLQKPFTPAHADFVARNLAKAQLAFGDVVLTTFGQYHWSCREREQRLKNLDPDQPLPWLGEVRQHHTAGVEFKLHPIQSSSGASALQAQHTALTQHALKLWLWLESRRLGHAFSSARHYAESKLDKCPETKPWRNRLINLSTFGAAAWLNRNASRYPRERILHALALMLWEPDALEEPAVVQQLQNELGTTATRFDDWIITYEKLWRRFN